MIDTNVLDLHVRPDGTFVMSVVVFGTPNVFHPTLYALDSACVILQETGLLGFLPELGEDATGLFALVDDELIRFDLDHPYYPTVVPVDGLLGFSAQGAAQASDGRALVLRTFDGVDYELNEVDPAGLTATPLGPSVPTRVFAPALGPPVTPQPIPTLGTWGVPLLAGCLALGAVHRLRSH